MAGIATIGAQIIFRTGKAILGVGKFRREIKAARGSLVGISATAKKAGVSVSTVLRVMENKRAPTQFQKNIALANRTVQTFTGFLKEARSAYKLFAGVSNRGIRVGGIGRAKRQIKGLTVQVRGLGAAFAGVAGGIALAIGSLGAGNVFGNLSDTIGGAIGQAAGEESSQVTFKTLLGSAEKTADLFDRITSFSSKTPFQRSDIIEGSKLLLNVTRDNVAENERLFKLAANIASLRPGKKVADVSRGIVSAARAGEFDILKSSFGILLSADQFKDAGKKGGKSYTKAVLGAIEQQFSAITGGRGGTLVDQLSATLAGKASTLKDNVDLISLTLGKAFVSRLNLKGILDDMIGVLGSFRMALKFVLTGEIPKDAKNFSQGWFEVSKVFVAGLDFMGATFKFFKNQLKIGFQFLEDNPFAAKIVAGIGAIGVSMSVVGTVVLPILTALIIGGGLLLGALAPLSGLAIPLLKAGFIGLVFVAIPLLIMLGAMTAAFFLFARKGESIRDTLGRLAVKMTDFGNAIKFRVMAVFRGLAESNLMLAFRVGLIQLSNVFDEIRQPIQAFFSLFSNDQAVAPVNEYQKAAKALGNILASALIFGINVVVTGMRILGKILVASRPFWVGTVSDIKNVARAFFDLGTNASGVGGILKTMFLGLVDIVTLPFRAVINMLLEMTSDLLLDLGQKIAPFSTTLSQKISGLSAEVFNAQEAVKEGFLATQADFKLTVDGFTLDTTVVQPITMDGEKVGEGINKISLRAKDSGRGGNPASPEELGFVVEGGGAGIRVVDFSEVASEG